MREWHKNKIFEMAETLNTACKELSRQQNKNFVGLCGEIQEFVLGMLSYIADVCGEEGNLSNLCAAFYEMLFNTAQGTLSIKQLLKHLRKIEVEILSLKPNEIEIAFFCYKASMSDSLESVYLAAKEDPACDAYFIPIPYFDRNPDGSLGKMHLEGQGYYSDKYELTDWSKYDVEAHHPDVIFIMNPYDENNHVTSVHPDYYSSQLRKYTDMLVYIEYGITLWIYRDSNAAFEKIKKGGILLPAYFNCDYYIAYSKEITEFFTTLFRANQDAVRVSNLTRRKATEKFLTFGSPKFDKVLNGQREEYALPEIWQQKIRGKKVVLYNCSLTELLKSSRLRQEGSDNFHPKDNIYFKKLRSIINTFQERDDVILWWRPHPLFEVTLSTMRTFLLDEYKSIVEEFSAMRSGIYDTTENLHRAIAWSDAMISDESSLLFLYAATGKPFYIPSITTACASPNYDTGTDFQAPLSRRLENMRAAKGANVGNWNTCIWWHNFLDEDLMRNTHFDNFTSRFIDYITHPEKYPEATEYQALQIQMFKDFVANADGTAGQKIYDFAKQKALKQTTLML